MTTAVSGLIKIGQTGNANFQERMRFLEANGYYNVSGLKRFFAIELEDYNDKENLLKEIFNKHRVGDSELFALDYDLVRQLLLSFEGKVIYPKDVNKEKEFDFSKEEFDLMYTECLHKESSKKLTPANIGLANKLLDAKVVDSKK